MNPLTYPVHDKVSPEVRLLIAIIERAVMDLKEKPRVEKPRNKGARFVKKRKAFEYMCRKKRNYDDAWAFLFSPIRLEQQLDDWGMTERIDISYVRENAQQFL